MGFKSLISTVLVGLLCLKGVECTCSSIYPNMHSDQVATMCKNSVVQGIYLFIDVDLGNTTTLESGTACRCHIQTQRGKKLTVRSDFTGYQRSKCGTSVDFTGNAIGLNTILGTPCYSYQFGVETHTYTNISVGLRRDYEPYKSTYCVSLTLEYCSDDQHQCGDGSCIPSAEKCDNFPDCDDGSDELSCSSIVCAEGQIPCDDNAFCINTYDRCDGVYHCPDQSDEFPKYCSGSNNGSVSGGSGATDELPPPLITVTCEESPYLPEPTTTSTTTTPETTSTTSTTTTSTPTTSTSSSSTTSTPTTSTTTSSTTSTPTTSTTTSSTTSRPTTSTTTYTSTSSTTTTPSTTSTTPTTNSTTPSTTSTTPTTSTSTTTTPTTTTSTTTTMPTSTSTTSTSTTASTSTTTPSTTTSQSTTTKTTPTETTPTSTQTTTASTPSSNTTTTKATDSPTTTSSTSTSTTTTQPTTIQTTTPKPRCNINSQFECGNGSCIPLTWRCDSLEDCIDKSDESGCSSYVCGENMFLCDERRTCIKASERCDGTYQCPDLSDELPKYCGKPTSAPLKEEDSSLTAIIVGVICGALLLIMTLTCIIYWTRSRNWNNR
ncbi:integumentary mucin C.1-like isoform X5 [Mercenaria mercenaria]|uniref:integumentary mucin C.1-like isoform X5 n=1 Tax=Mercenaria mercenaria TaxID=6596 RepID=UPI00234E9F0D|nr:integumentary mucin C.1-like isoform X5 [Mercenaria mercenaria]